MKRVCITIMTLLAWCIPSLAGEKLSGVPIASYQSNASLAFDNDPATKYYDFLQSSYAWVGLDLGDRHIIDKVEWTPINSNENLVLLGMFQGANNPDFSDAVPIYLIDDVAKGVAEVKCSRGFRYVRYVGPSNSYAQIVDIGFYGNPGKGDDSNLWQITNLPTISINTVDGQLPFDKETYISSTFILISEDGSNVLEQSKTGIRERGNASREFPKKPYKIKFDKKQNILDAPAKAKKWTLINNYGDKTLMRNMLAFEIAEKMEMEYVPYCTPVDVVINGEYKGCYQLCDQVEVNDNRIEIDEMESSDTDGEDLTGGYLVEVDAHADEEPVWFMTDHYLLPVTVKSPDDDVIVDVQLNYITDYFNTLEGLMKDTSPLTGYRTIFDNESFIRHMLVNELAGNTDAYWSTYMYKRRNDPRIYTGPVWDFDLGFNNDRRTYPVTQKSGNGYLWDSGLASAAGNMRSFTQRIITKDETTKPEIWAVWQNARDNGLSPEWLAEKVEEYAQLLEESQRLNFMRWNILNQVVHMNPAAYGSYEAECQVIRNYIKPRFKHLDQLIGYDASLDVNQLPSDDLDPEAVYYTITGVRVDRPVERGIYIEVKGRKSRKILIP